MKLPNYFAGAWSHGSGDGVPLLDPVRGVELARVSSEGTDYNATLRHARAVGGAGLRCLTYRMRAGLLRCIADVLVANRAEYYRIALENSGSPKNDAAIDIEGAIYTLKYFSQVGAALGDVEQLREGSAVRLGKDEAFQVLHLGVPLTGAAILINAFNFPAWGLWEKAAPALLSGVPVVVKPATATAWMAQRMIEDIVKADILPRGAISIVCGSAGDLLDHATRDDAIAFTGSAQTADRIRSHAGLIRNSTRINVEADSLNVAVLGPDVSPGSIEFDLFVNEVVAEMVSKAGQKCTAIRRVLVPKEVSAAVGEGISASLARVVIGDPRNPEVRMGPLVNKAQQSSVRGGIDRLARDAVVIFGGSTDLNLIDADPTSGAFVLPTLLSCEHPFESVAVHEVEVFGPVATLLPYDDFTQALSIAELGGGSLVASVFSNDPDVIEASALRLASSHGRVHVVTAEVARSHTGHGNVMPMSLHGGPGRAGNGQELGGLRALRFYHRYSAIQAPMAVLDSLLTKTAQPVL